MTRWIASIFLTIAAAIAAVSTAAPASAQVASTAAEATPAFSLSTSEAFTTRDTPHFFLTFRRVPQLDIRVYKVRDPFAFFAGLSDPHQFGTDEPAPLPVERSLIERMRSAAVRGARRGMRCS